MCDGVPCYIGIVLNATTWDQAKQIFAGKPDFSLMKNGDKGADIASGPVQSIRTFAYPNGIIFGLDITTRGDTLAVGRVIADLGAPCAITTTQGDGERYLAVLSFDDRMVWVRADGWRILPTSSVLGFQLGPTPEILVKRCEHMLGILDGSHYTWHGFGYYPGPYSGLPVG